MTRSMHASCPTEVVEGLASASFGFRQPSCRVYGDTVPNHADVMQDEASCGTDCGTVRRTTRIERRRRFQDENIVFETLFTRH
ncbi:MAG: hypothetical protein QOG67_1122 [Verrucomicrobiota bacterium]